MQIQLLSKLSLTWLLSNQLKNCPILKTFNLIVRDRGTPPRPAEHKNVCEIFKFFRSRSSNLITILCFYLFFSAAFKQALLKSYFRNQLCRQKTKLKIKLVQTYQSTVNKATTGAYWPQYKIKTFFCILIHKIWQCFSWWSCWHYLSLILTKTPNQATY